jgi:hypothetical protein
MTGLDPVEEATRRSSLLFPAPACAFTAASLDGLAHAMARIRVPASRIPSGYVYLGQFVAHDLSRLALDRQIGNAAGVRQLRTPALNLENVYGRGFDDPSLAVNRSTGRMELGSMVDAAGQPTDAADLPREGAVARIADERDDENLVVAQLHLAFLKLHNLFCERIAQRRSLTASQLFEAARRETILHYQEVVLCDFLRSVLDRDLWSDVVRHRQFRLWTSHEDATRMPLEFAAAAFRFGHSMVRRHYTLNARLPLVSLDTLFSLTGHGRMQGMDRGMPKSHRVDWRLFFPLGGRTARFMNYAMRLSPAVNIEAPPDGELLVRKSLQTGARCLPDAQTLVSGVNESAMVHVAPLQPHELNPRIEVIEGSTVRQLPLLSLIEVPHTFERSTPLAYYLLAEAYARGQGLRLGPLGGRIVCEVLMRLASTSNPSIVHERRDERFVRATGRDPSGQSYLRMSDILRSVDEPTQFPSPSSKEQA